MTQVPIVTEAGASMRDYSLFWLFIAGCVLGAVFILHRDLQAIAAALRSSADAACSAAAPPTDDAMP